MEPKITVITVSKVRVELPMSWVQPGTTLEIGPFEFPATVIGTPMTLGEVWSMDPLDVAVFESYEKWFFTKPKEIRWKLVKSRSAGTSVRTL